MGWSELLQGSKYLSVACEYGITHPELVLVIGLMFLLLVNRKFRAALTLAFGVTLCFANYFVFTEYNFLTIPLVYAAGFAGVSIFLLLLLVYEFIHTA